MMPAYILVFIVGAVIGSFLNVCIYRIPLGLSVVYPGSRCCSCGTSIKWYQNVPILSYLLLRGKCSVCGVGIGPRYLLIEMLTGFLYLFVVSQMAIGWWTLVYLVFVSALTVVTFIDLDHQIIPDVISFPGIIVGLVGSFLVPWLSLVDSVSGVLLGGGLLWFVAWAYAKIKGIEGMGGGDIKLLAMIGAFMGWQAILPVVFLSSVAGTIVGVPLMLLHRGDEPFRLPFGPFLSAAAVIWLFWGHRIWSWYLSLFIV